MKWRSPRPFRESGGSYVCFRCFPMNTAKSRPVSAVQMNVTLFCRSRVRPMLMRALHTDYEPRLGPLEIRKCYDGASSRHGPAFARPRRPPARLPLGLACASPRPRHRKQQRTSGRTKPGRGGGRHDPQRRGILVAPLPILPILSWHSLSPPAPGCHPADSRVITFIYRLHYAS